MERTKKRQLRQELHELLLIDDQWNKNPDSNLYKQITYIGEQLANEPYVWRKRTIEKEQYVQYVEEGYTFEEIAKKLKISCRTLRNWRHENNLM